MKHNLAASDAFADVVKVTIHAGLSNVKLIWYYLPGLPLWLGPQPLNPGLVLPDLAWSLRFFAMKFLQPPDYCIMINYALTFHKTNGFGYLRHYSQVQTWEEKVPELDNVAHLFAWLSNLIWREVMHVSAHQLPQYYQQQFVPSMVWTTSVMGYTWHKLAITKILQNFWLTRVKDKCIQTNFPLEAMWNFSLSVIWSCFLLPLTKYIMKKKKKKKGY